MTAYWARARRSAKAPGACLPLTLHVDLPPPFELACCIPAAGKKWSGWKSVLVGWAVTPAQLACPSILWRRFLVSSASKALLICHGPLPRQATQHEAEPKIHTQGPIWPRSIESAPLSARRLPTRAIPLTRALLRKAKGPSYVKNLRRRSSEIAQEWRRP